MNKIFIFIFMGLFLMSGVFASSNIYDDGVGIIYLKSSESKSAHAILSVENVIIVIPQDNEVRGKTANLDLIPGLREDIFSSFAFKSYKYPIKTIIDRYEQIYFLNKMEIIINGNH